MGRVDDAMRRVAGSGVESPTDSGAAGSPGHEAFSGREGDVFPAEPPQERPRLRSVSGGSADAPVRKPVSALLPRLSDRIGAGLSRKVVVDRDIDPASREQYRRLATSLHAAQAANGLKVVMMASALAGEGKSLTASNLALTFSESYQKNVLLIDGDLRRPTLHTVFGLSATPGLTDGMTGSEDRKLALHHVTPTLTVLTAGEPTSDPMGVLASSRMRRLVAEARETFDWVIVDTPPIGLLADASLLAEIADGAVLVVRASSTPHDIVQRAVSMLGRDRLLGVVLNRSDIKANDAYQSYYQAAPGGSSSR